MAFRGDVCLMPEIAKQTNRQTNGWALDIEHLCLNPGSATSGGPLGALFSFSPLQLLHL